MYLVCVGSNNITLPYALASLCDRQIGKEKIVGEREAAVWSEGANC